MFSYHEFGVLWWIVVCSLYSFCKHVDVPYVGYSVLQTVVLLCHVILQTPRPLWGSLWFLDRDICLNFFYKLVLARVLKKVQILVGLIFYSNYLPPHFLFSFKEIRAILANFIREYYTNGIMPVVNNYVSLFLVAYRSISYHIDIRCLIRWSLKCPIWTWWWNHKRCKKVSNPGELIIKYVSNIKK